MIVIKRVTCKNFLSYGNSVTVFDLNKHKTTLVRGKNGHGKSTVMDLILYALYGKPYRNINKNQLINSINKGGMVVEIFFNIGNTEYQITRGMKPNVFDIFRDGVLIEQNAATRDYQEILESQILKISERTFKQIAVLGSASYIPFMQLGAGQRRELVESILDIEVFSRMNVVLKERIASTKNEYTEITHKVELKKTEAAAQQKLIRVMQENTKARVADYETQKDVAVKELSKCEVAIIDSQHELDVLPVVEFDINEFDTIDSDITGKRRKIDSLTKKIKSVHTLDECPTCLQKVEESHVHNVTTGIKKEIEQLEAELAPQVEMLTALESDRKLYNEYLEDRKTIQDKIIELMREQSRIQTTISNIDSTINSILNNTNDIEAETEKLRTIGKQGNMLLERKNSLSEEKHLQEVAAQLLKDTGIKTAVVKEYLPIMNQLINKYLAMFDFFVDFTLDESFNEVIRSRGRDVFSYSSFSEGEKRRIDFAILMAFRQLAALKNSAKTNVLILDEIVDGAFDLDARVAFNDLLSTIPDSNVIVISHADASTEAYDRVIHVEKHGDFSVYNIAE